MMDIRGSFNRFGAEKLGEPRPEARVFPGEDYIALRGVQEQLKPEQRQWDIDVIKVTASDLIGGIVHRLTGSK